LTVSWALSPPGGSDLSLFPSFFPFSHLVFDVFFFQYAAGAVHGAVNINHLSSFSSSPATFSLCERGDPPFCVGIALFLPNICGWGRLPFAFFQLTTHFFSLLSNHGSHLQVFPPFSIKEARVRFPFFSLAPSWISLYRDEGEVDPTLPPLEVPLIF